MPCHRHVNIVIMLGIIIPVYRPKSLDRTLSWIRDHCGVPHRICVVEHYRHIPPEEMEGVDHVSVQREHPWPERGTGSRLGMEHFMNDPAIRVITELDEDCSQDITDMDDCYNSILQDSHVIIKSRRLLDSRQDRPRVRQMITNTLGSVTQRIMHSHIRDWSHTHRYYPVGMLETVAWPSEHLHTHMWNLALLINMHRAGMEIRERSAVVSDHNPSTINCLHLPRYLWEYARAVCR